MHARKEISNLKKSEMLYTPLLQDSIKSLRVCYETDLRCVLPLVSRQIPPQLLRNICQCIPQCSVIIIAAHSGQILRKYLPLHVASIFSAADGITAASPQVCLFAAAVICVQHIPQEFPVFSLRDILEKSALPRIASRRKGNAPICCLANEIDALAGKEIRAILDFINRILYGAVIAKRSAGKIEAGQVQNSDAVAAMTAKNTCHCAYIIYPLHLLCKRTSAVRRDGTHRFDMVLKVIVYFLYCRAARLQQRGPRRQIPKNYPPSCEKRKFPSCGKFGKM